MDRSFILTTSTPEHRQAVETKAQADKLELLYEQSFPAVAASLLSAVLVCILLWHVQHPKLLLIWFVALALSSLARVLLFAKYWRQRPKGRQLLAWEKPYFITLTVSSLIWGLGIVLILPDSLEHQVALYFFLVGMSGGALGVYSAHRTMALTTISIMLIPITLWALLQNQFILTVLAWGVVAFYVTTLRSGQVLSSYMHRSFMLTHELEKAHATMERLARQDELTQLSNRRDFYERGAKLAEHCRQQQLLLCMILMDVDWFKKINDQFGHSAGDQVLRAVGQVLRQSVRRDDLCARVGGEEFALLLPVKNLNQGSGIAEKLRQAIASTTVKQEQHNIHITASFGVSAGSFDLDRLFRCADQALYQAKDRGRNQVVSRTCT